MRKADDNDFEGLVNHVTSRNHPSYIGLCWKLSEGTKHCPTVGRIQLGSGRFSTALHPDVYLSDLLEHVHLTKPAKHVSFEGSDKHPNGLYRRR